MNGYLIVYYHKMNRYVKHVRSLDEARKFIKQHPGKVYRAQQVELPAANIKRHRAF